MSDDGVVLWSDTDGTHRLCYEIIEIAEGEFELRVLCDGHLWISELGNDVDDLVERARELRTDLHTHVL